jgi:hypothetical protein
MSEIDLLKVIELYRRERKHETIKFGDYKKIKSLNLASFILLLKQYVKKAEKAYTGEWSGELPAWLGDCAEYSVHGSAPIEAYEEVIKIMALAGAALETYCDILPDGWRDYLE